MKLLYFDKEILDKEIKELNIMANEGILNNSVYASLSRKLQWLLSQSKDVREVWNESRKSKYVIYSYFEINSYDDYLTQLETLKNQSNANREKN